MNTLHLHKEELDHELAIRSVFNLSTQRIKATKLKELLAKESAGLEMAPSNVRFFNTPEQEIDICSNIYNDIVGTDGLDWSDIDYLYVARSRLIHLRGRLHRIAPEGVADTELVAGLFRSTTDLLKSVERAIDPPKSNARYGDHELGAARVVSTQVSLASEPITQNQEASPPNSLNSNRSFRDGNNWSVVEGMLRNISLQGQVSQPEGQLDPVQINQTLEPNILRSNGKRNKTVGGDRNSDSERYHTIDQVGIVDLDKGNGQCSSGQASDSTKGNNRFQREKIFEQVDLPTPGSQATRHTSGAIPKRRLVEESTLSVSANEFRPVANNGAVDKRSSAAFPASMSLSNPNKIPVPREYQFNDRSNEVQFQLPYPNTDYYALSRRVADKQLNNHRDLELVTYRSTRKIPQTNAAADNIQPYRNIDNEYQGHSDPYTENAQSRSALFSRERDRLAFERSNRFPRILDIETRENAVGAQREEPRSSPVRHSDQPNFGQHNSDHFSRNYRESDDNLIPAPRMQYSDYYNRNYREFDDNLTSATRKQQSNHYNRNHRGTDNDIYPATCRQQSDNPNRSNRGFDDNIAFAPRQQRFRAPERVLDYRRELGPGDRESNCFNEEAPRYPRNYSDPIQPYPRGIRDGEDRQNVNFDLDRPRRPDIPRKTVPIHQWRISFGGDGKGLHLFDFLDQISVYQRSERVSNNELLSSVVHLLTGRAKLWYRSVYDSIYTWDEFVSALKREFLPRNYEYMLLADISSRIQRPNETFAEYITHMKSLFKCLTIPIDEEHKLFLVQKNLLPKYAVGVAPLNIQSLEQLSNVCRRIDGAYNRNNSLSMPFQGYGQSYDKPFARNPDRNRELMAIENPDEIADNDRVVDEDEQELLEVRKPRPGLSGQNDRRIGRENPPARPKVNCWNCGQEGHVFQDCKRIRKGKFCYKCGTKDTMFWDCNNCHPGNETRNLGTDGSTQGSSAPSALT